MGSLGGEKTVEIDAPVEDCYTIAADVENAPEWQGSLRDVEVLERDGDGRAALVETESDAKVKTVKTILRFTYEEPNYIRWVQEKGDMKSLDGHWHLEDLGGDREEAEKLAETSPLGVFEAAALGRASRVEEALAQSPHLAGATTDDGFT